MENNIKYTLITGATGGLGRAFVNRCAELGYNMILTGTKDEKLEKLTSEIKEKYQNLDIKYKQCDLSDIDSRASLIEYLNENTIVLDRLINNAGYITEGSIKYAEADTLIKCVRVNCEGVMHLTKMVLDGHDPKNHLEIITITSLAANYPMPYMAIYSATKSMLKSFMISLRYEYRHENVSVLVVQPGAIATSKDMIEAIEAQGFKGKLSAYPADKIAKNSLKKAKKNAFIYTPGFFNKLTLFFSAFATTKSKSRIAGNMWKKSQEKRNIK